MSACCGRICRSCREHAHRDVHLCGVEIIGLAASEARDPLKTIPKAIRYTVLCLVGLYLVYITRCFRSSPLRR